MTATPLEPLPSQPEERRFIVKLAVLLIVIVLALLGLLALRGGVETNRFPRVKLPDGSWLVARAVTVGTSHTFEQPFSLEDQVKRWRRAYTETSTTHTNRMVIWLTRENDRGEVLDLNWFSRSEIVLPEDFVIPGESYHTQHQRQNGSSGSGAGNQGFSDAKTVAASSVRHTVALARCEFPLLRPTEGKLRLNVYDGSKSVVAVLEVPYPKLPVEPTDHWQVDPLPATRSVGNLDVTLKSIEFHQYGYEDAVQVRPKFEFLHDGQASTTWLASSDLIDPLGNQANTWRANLSPLESVWKLQATLSQSPRGRFLPEEIGKLPPMELAPAKQMVVHSRTHTINGATLQVMGLGGPGPLKFTLPNSNSTVTTKEYKPGDQSSGMSSSCSGNVCEINLSSGHPFLITDDSYYRAGVMVQMKASDQDGVGLTTIGSSSSSNVTFWFFEPKPTSTSVTFEFLVQKPRQVEFWIAPPKPGDIQQHQN